MNTMKTFAILAVAVLASGQTKSCGEHGDLVGDCCVCHIGYKTLGAEECSVCEAGFVREERSGGSFMCKNGRPKTDCTDLGEYPLFGCSLNGKKIGTCSEDEKFPCDCSAFGGSCEEALAQAARASKTCWPAGPRMYTTFPNEPVMGENPFSLTFVGCDLKKTDTYVVIPAYDASSKYEKEVFCDSLTTTENANIDPTCLFDGKDIALGDSLSTAPSEENSENNNEGSGEQDTCARGFLIQNLDPSLSESEMGMNEFTYHPITMRNEKAFVGTDEEIIYVNGRGVKRERETLFRVCYRSTQMDKDGKETFVWQEVANHDHSVSKRDYTFKVSKTRPGVLAAGEDEGAAGITCCDGLKIGSLCLPLWVFLLLWFLMALCLCGMGYTLHKNNQEIEAQRNNEKYEKFNVDSEMSNLAAKQAEDDDDI